MAARKIDKVIVTNVSALQNKYGASLPKVNKATADLIAADLKRGLHTRLIALDDPAVMEALGGSAVTAKSKPADYKAAIDRVFEKALPDYVMILGAIDVVPHQDLKNPTDDEDSTVWSDLPYACQAPYSKKVRDFLAPTRVVGRLPDVTGGNDADYIVKLLKTAAKFKSLPPETYLRNLGISTDSWKKSTAESMLAIFSSDKQLHFSPPDGPHWTKKELGALSHFINCHGGLVDPHFYGEKGKAQPIAHDASKLVGRVTSGTIVAAECCYGAELYDPAAEGLHLGICNTYLAQGAYGFWGSSTIAYGPEEGNSDADLICQYFLKRAISGASLGRAALQARQDFVKAASPLDVEELKTLAQFNLLADPAIVAATPTTPAITTKSLAARSKRDVQSDPDRAIRRMRLADMGLAIGAAAGFATPSKKTVPSQIKAALEAAAKDYSTSKPKFSRFDVEFGHQAASLTAMAKTIRSNRPVAFHRAAFRLPQHKQRPGLPVQRVVVIATQVGEAISIRRIFTR